MGKPDQTEKMLLDYNDEFAEIFSATKEGVSAAGR